MPIVTKYDYQDVPTIAKFAASNAFIRGLVGPFGSGKSSGCVVEIIRRAMAQRVGTDGLRHSRWVVIRSTMPQLEDTTIKTFMQWVPPQNFGRYWESDHTYLIKGIPGCEIEIMFRALDRPDHIRNLLSLEVTGAWVNEAREVPWGIIEALQGRVGRYPAKSMGGITWSGIFMDTNPPDVDSRWYKFFEEDKHPPEFAQIFKQPSGLSAQAENLTNLPSTEYYKRLAVGKSPEWIKVYVDGEYGFVIDGKPVYREYNDQAHCKILQPIKGVVIYRSWDWGLCYSDDTEVLTNHGWKLFKDVDVKSDLAATRDPVTKEMTFASIAFKVDEPYEGEMLEWDSTELNLCVTPEHRVPFTYRDKPNKVHWQSAEWLAEHSGGHHYVDLCSDWNGFLPTGLETVGMEPMVFAEFMGLYLAEGSADGKRIAIYQKGQNPDMQRILDATGLKWKWHGGDKAAGWHIWNPVLSGYLKQFGKARQKYVPAIIKWMPPQHIRAFIMSYTAGDGHIRKRKNGSVEHVIFTTSKAMANDLQEMAQKAGWNSAVHIRPPQTSYIKENGGTRAITNGGGYALTFKKTATRAELLKRNFKRIPYNGRVYCLNVPNHVLYIRRKGKPSWNGNTPACVFSQVLPDGRWLIFDEIISEDTMGADRFSDEVITFSGINYPGAEFKDIGDPAGESRAQTDERTCFQILQAKGIDIEGGEQNVTIRLESVRKPLRTMIGGEPQFVLHPRCKVLRKGFLGGYKFRRMQVSVERYTSKPEKDKYSHPHDALQYAATRIFGSSLTNMAAHLQEDFSSTSYHQSDQGRSAWTGY